MTETFEQAGSSSGKATVSSERMTEQYVRAFSGMYPKRLNPIDRHILQAGIADFIASRNVRSDDLSSPEAQEAIRIETGMFPLGTPRLSLCVDGRVLAKLIASLHGGSMRTPAGDNAEFLPCAESDGVFLSEGKLARDLRRVFSQRDSLVWVFDSHLHCAARKAATIDESGTVREDDGLFEDVLRKKQLAAGFSDFVREHIGHEKRIIPIHISFDPHSGYLFMGLERELSLRHPDVEQYGFTEDVLETLTDQGIILSTRRWAEKGGMLHTLFSRSVFPVDYESNYRKSTLLFWQHLSAMAAEGIPFIEQEIIQLFPDEDEALRRERSVLLFANAYTAFLHNAAHGHYPYGEHDESIVVITYSERGPYACMHSFTVDPYNPNLSSVVKFVEGLVRGNRKAGRFSARERQYLQEFSGSKESFSEMNPVPVAFFQRLPESVSPEMLRRIEETDWSDIAEIPWMTMDREAFHTFLHAKISELPPEAIERFDRLRERAIGFFRPGLPATPGLLAGRIAPLWILSDPMRYTRAILPFLARGYSPQLPEYGRLLFSNLTE